MNYKFWLEQRGDLERYNNSIVCKTSEKWGNAILTIIREMSIKGEWREYSLMRRIIGRGELVLLLDRAQKHAYVSEQFKSSLEQVKKISKYNANYIKKIMCAPLLDEPITVEVIEGASTCYIVTSGCKPDLLVTDL